MDDIYEMFDLQDCPCCAGPSILEEECGSGFYVTCLDCGTHTPTIDFHKPEERVDAATRAVHLWNIGKVIAAGPGE